MRAVDIEKMPEVSRPTIHPSGDRAVVALAHPHLGANATVGQLWSIALDGAPLPRRITRGFRDAAPQFSPDGEVLAFLRSAPETPPQLFLAPAARGEPQQITDAPLGVESFRWAPDSASLVFAARVPEPGRYGSIEGLAAAAEAPRRQTNLRYRSNGLGYSSDRRVQLFAVTAPDLWAAPAVLDAPSLDDPKPSRDAAARGIPEATQLTPGEYDHGEYAFSRSGQQLRVMSARHEGRHEDLRSEVYEIELVGETPAPGRLLLAASANLTVEQIETDSDDAVLLVAADVGTSGRDFVAQHAGLYLLGGDAAPQRLSDAEIVDLGGSQLSLAAGGEVLASMRSRGTVRLVAINRAGALRELTPDSVEVTGHASSVGRIVYSFMDAGSSGDIAVIDGRLDRVLTDFSEQLRETGLARPRELTVTARDGYPVHGWVYLPEGDGPHPVLLNIHGGPFHYYSPQLFDEAQVYVDAGYAVVMCNPRGSEGYGQQHGRAIRQQMGVLDYHDVMDFFDGALASEGRLDAGRVGIMGGSYGGYLTAWIIAHEHRFAAAIVERGYLDPAAFIGTSDIGDFFTDEYLGTDPERLRAQSPQAVVDQVTTPTLVLHSEEDLRCPLGQAENYYAALKRRGVPSELLVFPGENHELSRAGRPRHRVQRFEAILEWWGRYLPIMSSNAG